MATNYNAHRNYNANINYNGEPEQVVQVYSGGLPYAARKRHEYELDTRLLMEFQKRREILQEDEELLILL